MLREPAFPPAVLEEQRSRALTAVEQQRREPEALVENALDRHGDPYPRGDVRHARSFDEIVADLTARDSRDSGRDTAPLARAADAALLDTSDLTIEDAVRQAIALVDAQLGGLR